MIKEKGVIIRNRFGTVRFRKKEVRVPARHDKATRLLSKGAGINKVKNWSFEKYEAGAPAYDFEDWTEDAGGFGIIRANTATKTHGSASVEMIAMLESCKITSAPLKLSTGEYFSLSLDARANVDGMTFRTYIIIGGKYWNFSERGLQTAPAYKETTVTNVWERYHIEKLHWSELGIAPTISEVDVEIRFETASGFSTFFFDAVHGDTYTERPHYPVTIRSRSLTKSIRFLGHQYTQAGQGDSEGRKFDNELE